MYKVCVYLSDCIDNVTFFMYYNMYKYLNKMYGSFPLCKLMANM